MKKTPTGSTADEEAALLAELEGSGHVAAKASADQTPDKPLRPETEMELKAAALDAALAGGRPEETDGDEPTEAELDEDGTPRQHPLLTNAEVAAIQKRARDRVVKEERDAAADLLLRAEIAKEQKARGLITNSPEDEIESVFLDLAEHSDRITLNGVVYFHGRRYDVPRHVARTMKEIMFRGWQHQIVDIDGKSRRDFYRRSYDTRLGQGGVVGGYTAQERAA